MRRFLPALAIFCTLAATTQAAAQTGESGREAGGVPIGERPELREGPDPLDAIFEDWRQHEYASGTLTMRSAGGSAWSVGNGPARLQLRLDGWSQQVQDDPFCLEAGLAGCTDLAGGRVGLEASFDLARNLELRLTVGASGATNSVAADAGASIIWWFSEHVGLVLGLGYLQPLPGANENSAVPAMLDFERSFTHETPYDLPEPGTRGTGQWFGGFGLITRD